MVDDRTLQPVFAGIATFVLSLLVLGPHFGAPPPEPACRVLDGLANNTNATALPGGPAFDGLTPFLDSKKVAVLVESRASPALLPAIDAAVATLPWDWRVQLFLSPENTPVVANAPVIKDLISLGKIVVSPLPPFDLSVHKYKAYNSLLRNISFWRSIVGSRVLIFQTDSTFCPMAPLSVDDFSDWDYVGAPWNNGSVCGNGGLSLRSRDLSIEALEKGKEAAPANEDLWFCKQNLMLGYVNAPAEISKRFSVERYFYATPVGVHKVHVELLYKSGAEALEKLYNYCPEARTLGNSECLYTACARDPVFLASLNRTEVCREGWEKRAKRMITKGMNASCHG